MKKQDIRFPLKPLAASFAVLLAGACLFYGVRRLGSSHFFTVKEVVCSHNAGVDVSAMIGKNIFSFNLKETAKQLSFTYPLYKRITLVRVLPSRIYVHFVERVPLAYVRLYKYFSVDEEGVLLEGAAGGGAPALPVIRGLETKLLNPKAGKRYYADELTLALQIIRQCAEVRQLRPFRVQRVDVATRADASFMLVPAGAQEGLPVVGQALAAGKATPAPQAIEVKIGSDSTAEKIRVTGELLAHFKSDWAKIKYIDVRFKEPAVKFKDNNAKK